jgi:glycosyltransferase involved in cell wall biosynthesis
VAKARRRPFLLWTGLWNRVETTAHRLFMPVTLALYQASDAIVVYGEHIRRYLASEGVPSDRVFVAPHAVDNEFYGRMVSVAEKNAVRAEMGVPDGQRVVLYLGRLEDGKGLSYLIEAFAEVNDESAVLVLAGAGSLRDQLQAEAKGRGIADRVRFTGYVPVERTAAFYAAATVYVLPSITTPRFKEPWGLVVNEAFNQGAPVIATDAVGAAAGGLVRDGENGFVVPERSSSALAAALGRVLGDAALRDRLSRSARETIAGWTQAAMVDGFRAAIQYATR